jgi:hypothetical protein
MHRQQTYKTVTLFSQPYLDTYNQCYKNIVTINLLPQGPLINFVRRIQFPPLSTFKIPNGNGINCNKSKQCGLALLSLDNFNTICNTNLMVTDEVPTLLSFLLSNGYSIDTSITKMLNDSDLQFETNTGNKIIAIITYNG